MSVGLPTLLYLGLYVAQSTQAQHGSLPPPVITAQPGPMVLYKEPVTILCQGPPDAADYKIYKQKYLLSFSILGTETENASTLSIQEMKPYWTGEYFCSYHSGERQSPLSDALRLVMTGSYDKPTLRSMSGTVVASGDNVKLQCFSRVKFEAFILTKEEAPQFTNTQISTAQDNGQQTTFHLDRVNSTQAGTYRCYGVFFNYSYVWSPPSNPLQLEVRGLNLTQNTQVQNESLPAPVITAQPGPMVLYNEPVTILCQGPPDTADYKIHNIKRFLSSPGNKLQKTENTNSLSIQEMKPSLTGMYFCSYQSGEHWSPHSNILHLVMTGSYDKPTLRSMSGTVVASGDDVNLQCFSRVKFDGFILTKEEAPQFARPQISTAQDNRQQTTYHLDRVNSTQAGTYRCYGVFLNDSYEWSHPSDPLQLEVTGLNLAQSIEAQNRTYDKPSLSSMSGTVVASGHNVRLQCFSRIKFEAFILTREAAPQFTQRKSSTAQDNGQQTTFHLDHVTSTEAGTYRCYGALSEDPNVWSDPSEPLQLEVRGPAGGSVSPVNQVRLSLAGLVLLALVVVLAEACYSHKRSFPELR